MEEVERHISFRILVSVCSVQHLAKAPRDPVHFPNTEATTRLHCHSPKMHTSIFASLDNGSH
jgi:hypothetical protein